MRKQMRKVQEMGCDHAQGFLYAKPVAPADAMAFIEQAMTSRAPPAA
jgi:EAL domain-containing protein (putative c-di-GMP-specific phosphodiesterase class I)